MSNPAFKTTNSNYGNPWLSSAKPNPLKEEVPTYSELGAKDLIVKHSLKVYKNEKIKELLTAGEAKKNEKEELELKMSTVPIKSKAFPVEEGKMTYSKPSNFSGNPLYKTSNMNYGSALPTNYDLPNRYYPRGTQFSQGFLGGMYADTGLQTAKTNSAVTKDFDGYFA